MSEASHHSQARAEMVIDTTDLESTEDALADDTQHSKRQEIDARREVRGHRDGISLKQPWPNTEMLRHTHPHESRSEFAKGMTWISNVRSFSCLAQCFLCAKIVQNLRKAGRGPSGGRSGCLAPPSHSASSVFFHSHRLLTLGAVIREDSRTYFASAWSKSSEDFLRDLPLDMLH